MPKFLFFFFISMLMMSCYSSSDKTTENSAPVTQESPIEKSAPLIRNNSIKENDSIVEKERFGRMAKAEELRRDSFRILDSIFIMERRAQRYLPKPKYEDKQPFYGVYEFEDNVFGINVYSIDGRGGIKHYYELLEGERRDKVVYPNAFLPLFKDTSITWKYNYLIGEGFYVYSEKARTRVVVKDILFPADESIGGFVALMIDVPKDFGKPLFASREKLNPTFGNYKKETDLYNKYIDIAPRECQFETDDLHIKIFAKLKDSYWGYRNNNYKKDIIPYRYEVKFKGNEAKVINRCLIDMYMCSSD